MENASVPQITTTIFKEASVTSLENVQPTTEQVIPFISSVVEPESVSQVTTTVVREYTVTEKIPSATSAESLKVSSSIVEPLSVSQVTTTIFREKTVTVPAPASVETGVDPCESVISAKQQPIVKSEAVNEEALPDQPVEAEDLSEEASEAVQKDGSPSQDLPVVDEEPIQNLPVPNLDSLDDADSTEQKSDATPNTAKA